MKENIDTMIKQMELFEQFIEWEWLGAAYEVARGMPQVPHYKIPNKVRIRYDKVMDYREKFLIDKLKIGNIRGEKYV